jgi:hypothetical protein
MRRHHGGRRAVPASTGLPGALGDPTQPRGRAGTHTWGFAGPAGSCTVNATSPLCGLGAGSSSVLDVVGRCGAHVDARERPDQRDRDMIGIRVRDTPHRLQPSHSAGGARSRWRAKEPCMHHPNPNPPRKPPAREPAAGEGRSRGRRPRSGPPWFTYEVQLLGGEAGRRLAQEQTEAIAAVRPGLPATLPRPLPRQGPTPSARPSGRARRRRPEHGRPSRAPQGQRPPARRPGRAGAGVRRHRSPTGQASPVGRAAWTVAGRGRPIRRRCGSRRWGWWGRASRSGRSHGRWACTRRRCAAGSGRPGAGGGPPWTCRSPTALTLRLLAMRAKKGFPDRPQGRLRLAGPR